MINFMLYNKRVDLFESPPARDQKEVEKGGLVGYGDLGESIYFFLGPVHEAHTALRKGTRLLFFDYPGVYYAPVTECSYFLLIHHKEDFGAF